MIKEDDFLIYALIGNQQLRIILIDLHSTDLILLADIQFEEMSMNEYQISMSSLIKHRILITPTHSSSSLTTGTDKQKEMNEYIIDFNFLYEGRFGKKKTYKEVGRCFVRRF